MKYRAVLKGVEAADLPRIHQTLVPVLEAAKEWAVNELKPYPINDWPDARVLVWEQNETLIATVRNRKVTIT